MTKTEATDVGAPAGENLAAETQSFARALAQRGAVLNRLSKAYAKLRLDALDDASIVAAWLRDAVEATADMAALELTRTGLLGAWSELAERAFLQLEARLRELAQARGWRIEGQWPDLYVERGVRISIDAKTRGITVGTKQLRNTSLPAIDAALEEQVKELIPRGFRPQDFIATLALAYDAAVDGRGTQRSILDVYRAFVGQSQSARFWRDARTELFTPVSADQFRARLSKALEAGVTSAPDGRELRLLPPLNPKEAMFIYQPAETRFGYVGRVEFVATDRGAE